jgi:thiol:disulfide interchange protein
VHRSRLLSGLPFAIALLATVSVVAAAPGAAGYDPAADPAADLAVAIERATAEGKRILLEVGGEWCSWCHRLERFVHDTPETARRLDGSFVVVKVNWWPENENEAFLSGYPEIHGFPHLFVLDGDGTLLHSQSTGGLEAGAGYDVGRFEQFLDTWASRATDDR